MFDWLKSLLSGRPKKPRDPSALLGAGGEALLPHPYAWSDSHVEQVKHFKQWVYVAVDSIARELAKTPPNVSYVRRDPSADPSRAYTRSIAHDAFRQRALTPLQSHERLEPVPDNHPLVRLLSDPNDPDSAYDLWYETYLFLGLCGVSYWWAPKNGLGLPNALWVVPSHWVWPVRGKKDLIGAYTFRPVEGNFASRTVPADEVIVFRKKNPISKLDGYSPQTAGAPWIDVNESVWRARWWTYKNGAFPTVAIQFDGSLHDPSDEELRRIEQKFIARQVGESKANSPLWLPPGVKTIPLTITPNQMVFGPTAAETRDNTLALYKVPKVVAGIFDGVSGRDARQAIALFHQLAVNPERRFISQALDEKLGPLYGDNLRLWWEDSTPQDPEILEQQLKTDLLYGARTANEVRAIRGLEPYSLDKVPWADDPVRPVNVETGSAPFGGDHNDTPAPSPDYDHPAINDDDTKNLWDAHLNGAAPRFIRSS